NADAPLEMVINIMTGDLQRIRLYAEKGFQIYQDIPEAVWKAYERLVALGFNRQLVKEVQ
ncbi:MAG TPA: YdcF family protein, partial [Chitinophagaceae bacterium]|nr:YdcF family protein [Chitinophagaceae bacterium]